MAPDQSVTAFLQRYNDLQVQRDTSDTLIKELLVYCELTERQLRQEKQELSDELRNCRLDLSDAISSRRDFQQRLHTYEENYEWLCKKHSDLNSRNPYVLLLLDGDGLIFQDHWIKQGVDGGKAAAYALKSAIAEQCGERADSVEVVAKVIANLGGLSRAMQRDGCVENPGYLKEFTLGFTQAKASFDFIDVGKGKERADSKIKELTRWHLQNHNCKQILLGISHDSGYAPFLDELFQDKELRPRITVIEGIPLVQELVATKVNTLNLAGDLFRSQKLQDRSIITPRPAPPPPAPTVAPVYASPATSTSSLASPAGAPVSSSSYANIISSVSPPPQITLPLPLRAANAKQRPKPQTQSSAPQKPAWSPGARGLDDPILFNMQAMEGIKKRRESNKLCNNHYLRGPCTNATCSFVHDYKPTEDELTAIALLARLNPCINGQDCVVDGCIYGHNCPSVRDGVCAHPYCKFPEALHPPGTRYKNIHIRSN